ncbi:MAG: hypothetical protein OXQ29_01685 [Rhodospirillaceae bacterium]|nr:hypothetical protein [Rhodospirillaceae bacterium]
MMMLLQPPLPATYSATTKEGHGESYRLYQASANTFFKTGDWKAKLGMRYVLWTLQMPLRGAPRFFGLSRADGMQCSDGA